MYQQMPTATTQEHKRNEGAPSATEYIIARDAVKAKPRAARSLRIDRRGKRLRLASKSTSAAACYSSQKVSR